MILDFPVSQLSTFTFQLRPAPMTFLTKRPCRSPGCSALVLAGESVYCAKHARPAQAEVRRRDHDRGSAHQRGYDWNWRLARLDFLGKYPVCRGVLMPTAQWSREIAEQFHELRERARDIGRLIAWPPECLALLAEYPIYEITREDAGRPALVVDHIVPHRGDQALFWAEWNWQGLTKHAHDSKTAREDRATVQSV
jgi:5-methylcytosine-specific restriction enzyme A